MKLTLARTCKGYILIVSREEEIIYVPDPLLHHDPAVECLGVLMFREWGYRSCRDRSSVGRITEVIEHIISPLDKNEQLTLAAQVQPHYEGKTFFFCQEFSFKLILSSFT